ncbi:MAG TPA: hypothetical protein VF129_00500, partial [Actinomycetota bacterium]
MPFVATSLRLPALLVVLCLIAAACTGSDAVPRPGGTTGPDGASDGAAPAEGTTGTPELAAGEIAELACSLPHGWLLRTWRGHHADRGADLQILPIEPNFVGAGLPHVGPWDYAQDIPMFWYGPGHVAPSGEVARPVT